MRPMLIRFAEMRVALDTETGEQANAIARRLAEIMPRTATYSDDRAIAWLSNFDRRRSLFAFGGQAQSILVHNHDLQAIADEF